MNARILPPRARVRSARNATSPARSAVIPATRSSIAVRSGILRLCETAHIGRDLLAHVGAEFLLKSVHVLTFALQNRVEELGIRHLPDIGRCHVLHFEFLSLGGLSLPIFSVTDRTFVEIYLLGIRVLWRSQHQCANSQKQNG